MASKAAFTPEEWNQVLGGVFMAGFAVTAADPSGLWGLLKETFAQWTRPHGGQERCGRE